MTMLRENRRVELGPPRVQRTVEWVTGLVGALAAAIGAWMYHGPADGVLTLFWWDFDVAALSEAWPLGLLVVGGLLAFAGFGYMARQMFLRDDEYTTPIVTSALVAIVGLVVSVAYLMIWIF